MSTITLHPPPFARSYWVKDRQVVAGFYPGDRDPMVACCKIFRLLQMGVTQFLNLMEADECDHARRPFLSYEPEFQRQIRQKGILEACLRRPIRDLGVPTVSQMIAILDTMDRVIETGGCLYVHCWGGRGRTGTVIGCWLARHGSTDPIHELMSLTDHAREWFPRLPETAIQRRMVQSWRAGQ